MKMNEFNYMSAALELFAATVTAVMLVGCFLERKHRTKTGKFLVGVLIAHTAMLLVDAPIWLLLAKPAAENVVWVKILSFFVDTFLCALISLYTYCLTAYISEKKRYHTDAILSLTDPAGLKYSSFASSFALSPNFFSIPLSSRSGVLPIS